MGLWCRTRNILVFASLGSTPIMPTTLQPEFQQLSTQFCSPAQPVPPAQNAPSSPLPSKSLLSFSILSVRFLTYSMKQSESLSVLDVLWELMIRVPSWLGHFCCEGDYIPSVCTVTSICRVMDTPHSHYSSLGDEESNVSSMLKVNRTSFWDSFTPKAVSRPRFHSQNSFRPLGGGFEFW